MRFPKILEFTHQLIVKHVEPGCIVIDATVGNGTDTLFLEHLVGSNGKVYGFDIQHKALNKAKEKIAKKLDDFSHITLFQQSHANMHKMIPHSDHGSVSAIMFNLGYLPGGDHSLVTQSDSTLAALEASILLLKKDGLITIIIYTGHPGGQDEANQINLWTARLPQRSYDVINYQFSNQKNDPPYLIAIQKL